MSLFVAIHPSEAAVEHLADALDRIRPDPRAAGLRWQAPGRWHVTIAFLGEQSEDIIPAVVERLDIVAEASEPSGPVRLGAAGVFGRQVLWMSVVPSTEPDGSPLQQLATPLRAGLLRDGLRLERRPWHPHLTVARARNGDPRPVASLLEAYAGPPWIVDRMSLIRSEGGPHPVHHVVHVSPLTGSLPGRLGE